MRGNVSWVLSAGLVFLAGLAASTVTAEEVQIGGRLLRVADGYEVSLDRKSTRLNSSHT